MNLIDKLVDIGNAMLNAKSVSQLYGDYTDQLAERHEPVFEAIFAEWSKTNDIEGVPLSPEGLSYQTGSFWLVEGAGRKSVQTRQLPALYQRLADAKNAKLPDPHYNTPSMYAGMELAIRDVCEKLNEVSLGFVDRLEFD